MAENAIVLKEVLALQKASDADFDVLSSGSAFLPRVMLMGSNSGLVQEGKMPLGHYAMIQDQNSFKDLGNEVDVLVCSWRAKAMDIADGEIIAEHDPKSAMFLEIVKKSGVKDSGCLYGPEFLLWIKSVSKFAGYFMSSKTSRREAPSLKDLLGKAATLKSRLIDPPKSRYKWHGPVIVPCSTPFDLPASAAMVEEIKKFQNPEEEERELADQKKEDERVR